MTERTIPIVNIANSAQAARPLPDAVPGASSGMSGHLVDTLNRPLRDLRISVTDKCNFRCTYCMPRSVFGPDHPFLRRTELLSFEEILRLAKIFKSLGVEKIRLTGGEPLLRKHLERLVAMLAALELDLTLTTNGSLLAAKARALRDAGLKRITVSLDSLDEQVFRAMNDADFSVSAVLQGIDAAAAAGFAPIKINMVVKRGTNDAGVVAMARHFKGSGHIVRFIEFMDVGSTNGWRMDDVVPSADIIRSIDAHMPLRALEPTYAGEVAQRWAYRDGSGEVGVISSVTQAFCRDCTRLRLSTEGMLYTCLFADSGYDLRGLMRNAAGAANAANDEALADAVTRIWRVRADRYSELRTAETAKGRKVEMSYIGG